MIRANFVCLGVTFLIHKTFFCYSHLNIPKGHLASSQNLLYLLYMEYFKVTREINKRNFKYISCFSFFFFFFPYKKRNIKLHNFPSSFSCFSTNLGHIYYHKFLFLSSYLNQEFDSGIRVENKEAHARRVASWYIYYQEFNLEDWKLSYM